MESMVTELHQSVCPIHETVGVLSMRDKRIIVRLGAGSVGDAAAN